MSTGLVALGSAAVFAVYATGFLKTKAAAAKFDEPRAPRRAAVLPGDATSVAAPGSVPPAELTAPGVESTVAPPPTVTLALPTKPVDRSPAGVASNLAAGGAPIAATAPGASPASAGPEATKTDAVAPTASTAATTTAAPPPVTSAAPASAPGSTAAVASAAAAATPVPAAKYKDGTYTGWGSCRHGDIQAQVVVAAGRIVSASIAQCLTRYSCSWISPLPPQVSQRQSPEVDYVSGATQSAVAFYDALVDALSKAK